ncbi:MAG: OmpP1/FadL family transporter [Myxococcaceae bacterium]
MAFAAPASANVYELVGPTPRASAMSGAQVADAHDPGAAFYNPSQLASQHALLTSFTFSYLHEQGDVSKLDPNDSRELDCRYCSAPDAAGFSIGLSAPLQGKLKDRVTVGLALYVPTDVVARTHSEDPQRPFWYAYDNNPKRLLVFLGAGVHVIDGLDVGAGAQVLADLVGDGATMRVDTFSKQVQLREVNSYLATRVSPTVGISITPSKSFRLGASYRHEMSLLYSIPASVELAGIGTLAFVLTGITHYTPPIISVGGAFDPTDDMTLSLDLTYEMWSRAPTPYVDLVVDLSGDTLTALGLDKALVMTAPHTSPGFSDTLNARLGYEYRVSDAFAVRAGAQFRPTPVPKQDAPGTNMLDGTRIGVSGGIGTAFHDPLELFEGPLHFDIGLQVGTMLGREAHKEDTDTVPSYRYSAVVFAGQASISYAMGGDEKPAPSKIQEEEKSTDD